jgi:hypothetical protein
MQGIGRNSRMEPLNDRLQCLVTWFQEHICSLHTLVIGVISHIVQNKNAALYAGYPPEKPHPRKPRNIVNLPQRSDIAPNRIKVLLQ